MTVTSGGCKHALSGSRPPPRPTLKRRAESTTGAAAPSLARADAERSPSCQFMTAPTSGRRQGAPPLRDAARLSDGALLCDYRLVNSATKIESNYLLPAKNKQRGVQVAIPVNLGLQQRLDEQKPLGGQVHNPPYGARQRRRYPSEPVGPPGVGCMALNVIRLRGFV